jgi:hypothetical protein
MTYSARSALAALLAVLAWPSAASAQACYLHVANAYGYKVLGGVSTNCWLRTYVTSPSPVPPAGFQHVGAAGTRPGADCVSFMASFAAGWAGQTAWNCFRQTFNGAVQVSKPPGAW